MARRGDSPVDRACARLVQHSAARAGTPPADAPLAALLPYATRNTARGVAALCGPHEHRLAAVLAARPDTAAVVAHCAAAIGAPVETTAHAIAAIVGPAATPATHAALAALAAHTQP